MWVEELRSSLSDLDQARFEEWREEEEEARGLLSLSQEDFNRWVADLESSKSGGITNLFFFVCLCLLQCFCFLAFFLCLNFFSFLRFLW